MIVERMKRRFEHLRRHWGLRVFALGISFAMLVVIASMVLPADVVEWNKHWLALAEALFAFVGVFGLAGALLSAIDRER